MGIENEVNLLKELAAKTTELTDVRFGSLLDLVSIHTNVQKKFARIIVSQSASKRAIAQSTNEMILSQHMAHKYIEKIIKSLKTQMLYNEEGMKQ